MMLTLPHKQVPDCEWDGEDDAAGVLQPHVRMAINVRRNLQCKESIFELLLINGILSCWTTNQGHAQACVWCRAVAMWAAAASCCRHVATTGRPREPSWAS